jgi:hypothetical protein
VWDQNTVNRLKYVDNKWANEVEFWFDRVKEGYIVEFYIECSESFNTFERKFCHSPIRILLEEIPLWIKMFFVEKGIMHMDPDRMVK